MENPTTYTTARIKTTRYILGILLFLMCWSNNFAVWVGKTFYINKIVETNTQMLSSTWILLIVSVLLLTCHFLLVLLSCCFFKKSIILINKPQGILTGIWRRLFISIVFVSYRHSEASESLNQLFAPLNVFSLRWGSVEVKFGLAPSWTNATIQK